MTLNKIFFSSLMSLCMFMPQLSAEYIVFKKGTPPTAITNPTEYKKIYAILMNYQWPMVIGYASHMSQTELKEISAQKEGAEENFLRKKLQALNSDYDLVFIPTIIYELFVIERLFKSAIPELQELNDLMRTDYEKYSLPWTTVSQLLGNPATTMQDWYNLYKRTNDLDIARNAHQAINGTLLEAIKKSDPSIANLQSTSQQQIKLTQALIKTLDFPENNPDLSYLGSLDKVKTFINFERAAYTQNRAILYRGESARKKTYVAGQPAGKETQEPIDISFLTKLGKADLTFAELKEIYKNSEKSITFAPWQADIPLGSVSYGNSLLGGYVYDEGACAAHYFSPIRKLGWTTDTLGYGLLINKQEFLIGNLKSLFNCSLLNTLISIFARGEFFHSRTVSYIQHPTPNTYVPGIVTGALSDKAGIILRTGNPLQKAYELSAYIGQYARILKLPNGTFNPTNAQIQPYYDAQNQVTTMLKAMSTIKKHVAPKK